MAQQTIRMGKRGTLVLPASLRKQLGLADGAWLSTEAKDGEIRIRPVYVYQPRIWSNEERSYFILNNSMTKEEWDANLPEVKKLGIDPTRIKGLDPNHRASLPTKAQWDHRHKKAASKRVVEKMIA